MSYLTFLCLQASSNVWKQAIINSVFKKDDASDPSDYRPTSPLSCIVKVIIKLEHKCVLTSFVTIVKTALQSGFMLSNSTFN